MHLSPVRNLSQDQVFKPLPITITMLYNPLDEGEYIRNTKKYTYTHTIFR